MKSVEEAKEYFQHAVDGDYGAWLRVSLDAKTHFKTMLDENQKLATRVGELSCELYASEETCSELKEKLKYVGKLVQVIDLLKEIVR